MPDRTQDFYNKFNLFPNYSYNVIKYLVANNETIFRLLKYNDADAWRVDSNHPNLTVAEKGALIYDGIKKETDCRIFNSTGQNESWDIETSVLRISPIELIPVNYIYGKVVIGFEVFSHVQCVSLSNYQNRIDLIIQQLLETLNGSVISGLGRLFFDLKSSSKCRIYSIGSIPYRGKMLVMCNYMT